MASRLRAWQTFDLIGQVACCVLVGAYGILGTFWGGARYSATSVLFALGGWQLLSAIAHACIWRRLPGRKRGRRVHGIAVILLAVVLGLAAAADAADGKSGSGTLVFLLLLLALSPILAVLYFITTAVELRRLVGQDAAPARPLPPADLRRTGFQALLLILAALPLYTLFGMGLLHLRGQGVLIWSSLAAGFALALWLGAELVRYRRAGHAARGETVCAGLFALHVVLFTLLRVTHAQVPLAMGYAFILIDFRAVLTAWLVFRLHRLPAQDAAADFETDPAPSEQPFL